ncbi:hypothetical protein PG988_015423 [Apiospora saccharicola]
MVDFLVNHLQRYKADSDPDIDPLTQPFIRMLCPGACRQRASNQNVQLQDPDHRVESIPKLTEDEENHRVIVIYNTIEAGEERLGDFPYRRDGPKIMGRGKRIFKSRSYQTDPALTPRKHALKETTGAPPLDSVISTMGGKTETTEKDKDDVLALFAVLENLYRTCKIPGDYDALLDANLWNSDGKVSAKAMKLITGRTKQSIKDGLIRYQWKARDQSYFEDTCPSFFSSHLYDDQETLRYVATYCMRYYGSGPIPARLEIMEDLPESHLHYPAFPIFYQDDTPLAQGIYYYRPEIDRFLYLLFPNATQGFDFNSIPCRNTRDLHNPKHRFYPLLLDSFPFDPYSKHRKISAWTYKTREESDPDYLPEGETDGSEVSHDSELEEDEENELLRESNEPLVVPVPKAIPDSSNDVPSSSQALPSESFLTRVDELLMSGDVALHLSPDDATLPPATQRTAQRHGRRCSRGLGPNIHGK